MKDLSEKYEPSNLTSLAPYLYACHMKESKIFKVNEQYIFKVVVDFASSFPNSERLPAFNGRAHAVT